MLMLMCVCVVFKKLVFFTIHPRLKFLIVESYESNKIERIITKSLRKISLFLLIVPIHYCINPEPIIGLMMILMDDRCIIVTLSL